MTEHPFEIVIHEDGTVGCISNVNGTIIAWSICGACKLHISLCTEDFPTEPDYITRWRDCPSGQREVTDD